MVGHASLWLLEIFAQIVHLARFLLTRRRTRATFSALILDARPTEDKIQEDPSDGEATGGASERTPTG